MSIQNEISRIEQAKSDIKSAIEGKGVEVPESVKIDGYPELVRKIENKIEKNCKYRFGVISDIHIGKYDGENDFKRAIRFFESQKVDFVVITGDLTNNGTEEEIIEYKRIKDELNVTFPIYAVKGNHDAPIIETAWETNTGNPVNHCFEKDGDLFVFLSIDAEYKYKTALNYLNNNVSSKNRVFLFMHYPIFGYAGLKNMEEYGFLCTDEIQFEIYNYFLDHYILFSGHTHYDFDVENTEDYIIFQNEERKTTVHVPSCAYTEDLEHTAIPDNSQGYIVDVHQEGVNIRGVDFKTGLFLSKYDFFVCNKSIDRKKRYVQLCWNVGDLDGSGNADFDPQNMVTTLTTLKKGKTYYVDMFSCHVPRVYFYDLNGNFVRRTGFLGLNVLENAKGRRGHFAFITDDNVYSIRLKVKNDGYEYRNVSLYYIDDSN